MATEPYRPSNGTEGEIFYEKWCTKCHQEQGARRCKIYSASLAFSINEPGYPKEWVRDVGPWPGDPRCTAWREPRRSVRHTTIRDKRQPDLMRQFPAAPAGEG